MNTDLFIELSRQINEVLTAATVIVAASMLLYNLTHGPNNLVARVSSILLGCVTVIYVGDVFVTLSRLPSSMEAWLRFEWIGIAFAPAALFHLSDSLLATTGLISRGRRRRVVRLLYLFGALFLLVAATTDLLVHSLLLRPLVMMKPGPLFGLYVIYFVAASAFAFNNVLRARRRCLTRATHRRMTYLLFALVTPVAGIFPYSLLFHEPSTASEGGLWLLVNLGNLGIVLMLILMAYPLSFFGPRKPDRVIKAELLSFMLRGPVTGIAVLVVILFVPRLSVFGLPSGTLMPFVAVATVMGLQWFYTIAIPFLERRLIYTGEQEQARQIQELSAHLLTRADARQLLEATLAAICDYLRVPSAFVASLNNGEGLRIEQAVGPLQPTPDQLAAVNLPALLGSGNGDSNGSNGSGKHTEIVPWQSFWLIPLRGTRSNGLIGMMGVWARSPTPNLLPEEEKVFSALYRRTARVLDDVRLLDELFARVEDVLQDTDAARVVPETLRAGYPLAASEVASLAQNTQLVDQPDFVDVVKDALRDYWGGPRLTDSRLLQLKIVERLMAENEGNPAKTVRALLSRAIEQLKPEGQRSLTMTEWTLYNILDLRFVQGKKVREVARQLAISEADLYRKQRIAIEQVAQRIADMEHRLSADNAAANPTKPPLPPPDLAARPAKASS